MFRFRGRLYSISENTLLPGEKILWVSFWEKNKKKGMKKGSVKEKGRKGKEKEKIESKGGKNAK
jgi:hypothetical protein